MRNLIRRTTSVWRREEGFLLLLVVLFATVFAAPLLKEEFPVLAAVNTAFLILLFVVGALVVSRSAWMAVAVSVLAGSAVVLEVLQKVSGVDPLARWRAGAECLAVGLFALVTLARVFATGPVTSHRLVGAVVAYLLVGLTWAYLYEWLEIVRPGSFQPAPGLMDRSYPTLLYFSFVTLATVGYGDVTPVSSAARALANIESLVGVLYPAILIGRLISKEVSGGPPASGSGQASAN